MFDPRYRRIATWWGSHTESATGGTCKPPAPCYNPAMKKPTGERARILRILKEEEERLEAVHGQMTDDSRTALTIRQNCGMALDLVKRLLDRV